MSINTLKTLATFATTSLILGLITQGKAIAAFATSGVIVNVSFEVNNRNFCPQADTLISGGIRLGNAISAGDFDSGNWYAIPPDPLFPICDYTEFPVNGVYKSSLLLSTSAQAPPPTLSSGLRLQGGVYNFYNLSNQPLAFQINWTARGLVQAYNESGFAFALLNVNARFDYEDDALNSTVNLISKQTPGDQSIEINPNIDFGSFNVSIPSSSFFADGSYDEVGQVKVYLDGVSISTAVEAVPEPSTLIGTSLALAIGTFLKRRFRKDKVVKKC